MIRYMYDVRVRASVMYHVPATSEQATDMDVGSRYQVVVLGMYVEVRIQEDARSLSGQASRHVIPSQLADHGLCTERGSLSLLPNRLE
jgi:hypothetical protein